MSPYSPRPVRFLEVWEIEGWRMKAYSISYGRDLARPELVSTARNAARERLSLSGPVTQHYGVGFVGIHDGKTANFVFVDWWAHENELHHHVFKTRPAPPEPPLCSHI